MTICERQYVRQRGGDGRRVCRPHSRLTDELPSAYLFKQQTSLQPLFQKEELAATFYSDRHTREGRRVLLFYKIYDGELSDARGGGEGFCAKVWRQ